MAERESEREVKNNALFRNTSENGLGLTLPGKEVLFCFVFCFVLFCFVFPFSFARSYYYYYQMELCKLSKALTKKMTRLWTSALRVCAWKTTWFWLKWLNWTEINIQYVYSAFSLLSYYLPFPLIYVDQQVSRKRTHFHNEPKKNIMRETFDIIIDNNSSEPIFDLYVEENMFRWNEWGIILFCFRCCFLFSSSSSYFIQFNSTFRFFVFPRFFVLFLFFLKRQRSVRVRRQHKQTRQQSPNTLHRLHVRETRIEITPNFL
jgi:hypothetical protein